MRGTFILLITAVVALLSSPIVASPAGLEEAGYDELDWPGLASDDTTPQLYEPDTAQKVLDVHATTTTELEEMPAYDESSMLDVYHINCTSNPNVCENWCYYVFCHKRGKDRNERYWTVTVNRNAKRRGQSECGRRRPNKCSRKKGMWPPHPDENQECDEQPKNTNDEGGRDAATRCMSATENRREGAEWANFINKGHGGPIPNGRRVRVQLNHTEGMFCASYRRPNTTRCPRPASPTDRGAPDDHIRQQ